MVNWELGLEDNRSIPAKANTENRSHVQVCAYLYHSSCGKKIA